jgi:hypothetical protein
MTLILFPLLKGLFSLVPIFNQWLTLQVPDCSLFRVICDVPSKAVFCAEAAERFPNVPSQFFFNPFVTMPVA